MFYLFTISLWNVETLFYNYMILLWVNMWSKRLSFLF